MKTLSTMTGWGEREREEEEGGIIITRYLGAINKYAFTGLFEIAQLEKY